MRLVVGFFRKVIRFCYLLQARYIFRQVHCNFEALHFGADVPGPFIVRNPESLTVGDGTSISGRMYIHARGGVKIGRCCHVAQGLTIYSHNHNWKSEDVIPYDDVELLQAVSIGDAVWIGANVTIAPGATIGNGVIVSAGSVVFGDIPDCAIIRGNPATILSYRDRKVFQGLYLAGKMV